MTNRIGEFKVILAFYKCLIIYIKKKVYLYVLPYGQMSLWGATVITNLMSAIPWVGKDIVESNYFADSCITAYSLSSLFPTIGTVNTNALKKRK